MELLQTIGSLSWSIKVGMEKDDGAALYVGVSRMKICFSFEILDPKLRNQRGDKRWTETPDVYM